MADAKSERIFLIALLLGALALAFFIFRPFLAPLALAVVVAVIVQPLYGAILARLPAWPSLSALITVLISVICILIPLSFIGSQIALEAKSLYATLSSDEGTRSLRNFVERVEEGVSVYVPVGDFSKSAAADIDVYLKTGLSWLVAHIGSAFSSIAALFLNFLIFFIALYYLLRDGGALRRRLIELSPLADKDDTTVFARLQAAVNSVVKGNLLIALTQGFLTAIGFTLFGVPNSVLWGSVAAVAALIPGFGTALVIVPGVLFLFISGNAGGAIGLIVWGVIAVGLIDNFLGPKLVGGGMKLHPLLVLISVLGGILFYGPLGIFLGPLTLSLLFAFIHIYADSAERRASSSA